MKISVLIPFRSTDPQRIRIWNHLRPQWEAADVELVSLPDSDDPTAPFSFARGANRCRAAATGDVLLVHGADQLLPDAATWERIRSTMATKPWLWVYDRYQEIDAWPTRWLVEGVPLSQISVELGRTYDHCYGIYAVRADVWDEVGGLDERLIGWGPEDAIFYETLRVLYPDGVRGQGLMRALWHERAPRDRLETNHNYYREYMTAIEAGRLREYLQEVAHDRARG